MALRLTSINRWCVSGTPVQRGLEGKLRLRLSVAIMQLSFTMFVTVSWKCSADLYGLVLFLGVDPYWVKYWWDQLLYRPYRHGNTGPLYSVIGQLLWRSAKKDVIDQVGY